jgi:hypothetical protein
MSTVIETLVTRLGFKYDPSGIKKHDADVKASTTTLAKSERQGRTWGASMASAGKTAAAGMRTFASGVMAVSKVALTAGAVVGGVAAAMVTNFASVGDEIAKTSKKVGVTTDQLQRMRFAAGRSGASSEALSVAVKTLNRQMLDVAKTGKGPLADGLQEIGLRAEHLNGLDTEQRFSMIADALRKVDDPARKSAIAMKIFGEQGTQLIPMLDEGSAGLARLYRTAEQQPDFLKPKQLSDAEKLNDALGDLRASVKGAGLQIASSLAPVVGEMAEDFAGWIRENDKLIKQDLPALFSGMATALGSVGEGLGTAIEEFGQLRREAALWDEWSKTTRVGAASKAGAGFLWKWQTGGFVGDALGALGNMGEPTTTATRGGYEGESEDAKVERMSRMSPAQIAGMMIDPNVSAADKEAASKAINRSADRTRNAQAGLTRLATDAQSVQSRVAGIFGGVTGAFAPGAASVDAAVKRGGRGGGGGRASSDAAAETGPTIDELINGLGEGGKSMRDVLDAARMGGGSGLRQTPLEGAQIVRIDASFRPNNTVTIEIPPEMLTAGMTDYAGHVAQVVKQQLDEQARQAYQHYDAAVRI